MEVREIEFGDLFLAAKIFKKIDLKPFIKRLMFTDVKVKTPEEIKKAQKLAKEEGFDLFMFIIENIDDAEADLFNLLKAWTGLETEAIKKFKLVQLKEFYEKLIAANSSEGLKSFFKKAAG